MAYRHRIGRGIERISALLRAGVRHDQQIEDIKIAQGRILGALNRRESSTELRDYEFKVFSQWGEDGIIQKLVDSIEIPNKTFVEFGVEDFLEANCRFLMMKDNWAGLVIDGSLANAKRIEQSYYYWRYELSVVNSFVTRENINALISAAGFSGDIGILSIDVDGVDYHIWEAITVVSPRIVIVEYNSVFGPDRAITVPYDPAFQRTAKHYSNLYFSCSIKALARLGQRLGYTLVGGTSQGVNAFFVRSDLMTDKLRSCTPEQAYAVSRFRESRDRDGLPSFVDRKNRYALIRGLPVLNVETGNEEPL